MESPLDILSRAAGMVSPSNTSDMRLKRNDPPDQPTSSSRILKKALNQTIESDDQPLDMTCKKKKTSSEENYKKKWNNGNDLPPSTAKVFENSTSDGSGTDHARRPSVIYYATQTPATSSVGGSGGKFRRRFRHPSNSSTSTDSDAVPAPLIRRKLVKRKRKRPPSIDREVEETGCKSRRVVVITSKEDDIDEHFRRSLGDQYDQANKGASQQLEQTISVDDHFAKALGTETWSRLISSKPTSIRQTGSPPESKDTVATPPTLTQGKS